MKHIPNKLLAICGPTATGKTDLALKVAKGIPSDLVVCDSRQVYRYMDVGTGKDIPEGFRKEIDSNVFRGERDLVCYTNGETRLWGYDLINPDEEFSLRHYVDFASKVIHFIWQEGKLPVLVGGTGYYLRSLLHPPETMLVERNRELREKIEGLSVAELQAKLELVDSEKLGSMNESDRFNPHRLIRAIEVSASDIKEEPIWLLNWRNLIGEADIKVIGLRYEDRGEGDIKIAKRVESRLALGFENEVRLLQEKGYWNDVPQQTLGYRQWDKLQKNTLSREDAIEEWKRTERAYARRQMTWFKKEKSVEWYMVEDLNKQQVVQKILEWYSGK